MLPKSKWIKGLTAEEPYSQAARRAVGQRLPLVWHYLPLAAARHEENVEYVHQLRVATRRAAAAIEVFSEALPRRRTEWMNRQLKRVRRAAAEARDLDVLAARLSGEQNGYKEALDEITLRRVTAQEPIIKAYAKLEKMEFALRADELAQRIRWRGDGSEPKLSKAARRYLKPISKRFIRQSKADLSDMRELHELRKDAKQLRYAMELLAGALDETFREDLYRSVEEIQAKLGTINDHHVARNHFRRWARSSSSRRRAGCLEDLASKENDAMLIKADAFRGWFSTSRRSEFETQLRKVR